MHTKTFLTGVIAFSALSASFAEGNFGPAWVEGHNYKVVDGQLVDLGPSSTPTPTPSPTPTPAPSPTPLQTPQINITVSPTFQNQKVAVTPPAPAPTLQPAPASAPSPADSTAWVQRFAVQFINAGEGNPFDEVSYYANVPVRYFNNGLVSKDFIARDIAAYDNKWIYRKYDIVKGPYVVWETPQLAQVFVTLNFTVQNRRGHTVTGTTQQTFFVDTSIGGVTAVKGTVLNRKSI